MILKIEIYFQIDIRTRRRIRPEQSMFQRFSQRITVGLKIDDANNPYIFRTLFG